MAAAKTFWCYLALLAVSFSGRSTASRVLHQAPPLPIPMAPPSPGLPPAGGPPGQCAGVTLDPSALGPVAANCTGPQLSQIACCNAISGLWEMAGIESPQAAQTLGTATIDFSTEQACLAVTQQALAPLGVTIDLRQLCAGPLGVFITPGNTCPSKGLPPAATQNVMSACANVPTPDAACGPCFTALTSAIASLLAPAAAAAPTAAAPPAIAAAATARDCATVAIARLLAQNPGFYRVGALLNQAFNGTGCPAAMVSGSMATRIPGP